MTLNLDDVKKATREALAEDRQGRLDPFRPYLQFLIGLITFALAILVGVFAALPKEKEALATPFGAVLGGVLAWMSLAALVATLSAAIVQATKYWHSRANKRGIVPAFTARKGGWLWLAALAPVVPGFVAVLYCLRAGAAMLNGATSLQDSWAAFLSLF